MSQEIVDAVRALAREKGIAEDKLIHALEDALLSAYKKQPGAARYARVDMDRETADFKVFELLIPPELEEQLLAEVEVEEEDRALAVRLMAERTPEDIAAALVHMHRATMPQAEDLIDQSKQPTQDERSQGPRAGFEDTDGADARRLVDLLVAGLRQPR